MLACGYVGMVLPCEAPEGRPDDVEIRVSLDAEDGVVISEPPGHRLSILSMSQGVTGWSNRAAVAHLSNTARIVFSTFRCCWRTKPECVVHRLMSLKRRSYSSRSISPFA